MKMSCCWYIVVFLNKRWLLYCITISTLLALLYFYPRHIPNVTPTAPITPLPLQPVMTEPIGFLINTPGCKMPKLDPFDYSVKPYLKKGHVYDCDKHPPLVESDQTALYINFDAVRKRGIPQDELSCCYQPIYRNPNAKMGLMSRADNDIKSDPNCYKFEKSVEIDDEYVRVVCYAGQKEVYKDFHGFIVPKQNNARAALKELPIEMRPNVLIVGIDSVSRLNFHRQMPKTRELLKSLWAVDLSGYNKVGDNTFPNLMPILLGRSVDEMKKTCWKTKRDNFDKCPFIWNDFKEKGYVTAFAEDASWMGLFQYLRRGFFKQPVDYYLHTMMTTAEKEIGHERDINSYVCLGPHLTVKFVADYTEKLAINLTDSDTPFFAFSWVTSLTHDYLNPSPQLDDTYEQFFNSLDREHVLNSTLVVFLSDHGMRWGPIRETYQGRIEERLPFVYLLLPEWFKTKYSLAYENILRNQHMLTTPFDVHETLKDFMNVRNLKKTSIVRRFKKETGQRGISLFLSIPEKRTCEDAGIADNWCTCHESQSVDKGNPKVGKAAIAIVDEINAKLVAFPQCAHLALHEIKSAMLEAPREEVKSKSNKVIQDWTVVLVTSPGFAEFEATVRERIFEESMKVLGDISRINAYGNQSSCVDDFNMRLYCYC